VIKWIIVAAYLGAILYVHFRGKVRLPLCASCWIIQRWSRL
jgi:hypothetical protein